MKIKKKKHSVKKKVYGKLLNSEWSGLMYFLNASAYETDYGLTFFYVFARFMRFLSSSFNWQLHLFKWQTKRLTTADNTDTYKTHNNENSGWDWTKRDRNRSKKECWWRPDRLEFNTWLIVYQKGSLPLETEMNGNSRGLKCKWCAEPTATTDRNE